MERLIGLCLWVFLSVQINAKDKNKDKDEDKDEDKDCLPEAISFDSDTVSAIFSSPIKNGGCVSTSVGVVASESTMQSCDPTSDNARLFMLLTSIDVCTGEIHSITATADHPTLFVIDKHLRAARLQAEVDGIDESQMLHKLMI